MGAILRLDVLQFEGGFPPVPQPKPALGGFDVPVVRVRQLAHSPLV